MYCSTILTRGPAARPRCIPPAYGAIQASSLFALSKRIAVLSLASCGRCTTSQGSVPAALHNPMTKGRCLYSLWKPIDQLFRRWITASISLAGLRPGNVPGLVFFRTSAFHSFLGLCPRPRHNRSYPAVSF